METNPSAISALVDDKEIANLPLNGRRFTDLLLLSPGVTQDPRDLTSGSNGDLSYGGIRGTTQFPRGWRGQQQRVLWAGDGEVSVSRISFRTR